MQVRPVTDPAFNRYGKVVEGVCTRQLMEAMEKTPLPDQVVYVASVPELERLPVYDDFSRVCYGGMPVQIGYCNGDNHHLNALEYHRDSEFNLACSDLILLIGHQQDIDLASYTYDTAQVEAFLVPKGTLIEVYATTLHYAPVAVDGRFRCVVVLPRGTNEPLPFKTTDQGEDKLLTHVNKWLIAHAEAGIKGAHIGLVGENITL